jgi:hypothetical protein
MAADVAPATEPQTLTVVRRRRGRPTLMLSDAQEAALEHFAERSLSVSVSTRKLNALGPCLSRRSWHRRLEGTAAAAYRF